MASPLPACFLGTPKPVLLHYALIDFLALLGGLSEFRFTILQSFEMDIAWDMAFLFFSSNRLLAE